MKKLKDILSIIFGAATIIIIAYFMLLCPVLDDMHQHGTSFIISLIRVGGSTVIVIILTVWFKALIG